MPTMSGSRSGSTGEPGAIGVKRSHLAALLSFNGGFVDTAGFLGLAGLFTAHVTGTFVTLGAALVFGTQGVIGKLAALPEFVLVIALTQLIAAALTRRRRPVLRLLLGAKVVLLIAFFALAVGCGPFANSDAPAALLAGFAGVAAMAVQNTVQRTHLGSAPPTTIMTGNTTQAVLDAVELLRGAHPDQAAAVRARFAGTVRAIVSFAAGCAVAALLYAWIGFWNLAVPVVVAAGTVLLRLED
jgi:uncharacterized membrane protein YoaK (UPF0700 family)